MYLDALTLSALADEMRPTLVGGRVQAVTPVDPLTLALEVYSGRRSYLLLSANPQTPRAFLTDVKGRRGVETETPFLLMLRKFVRGSRLTAVEAPNWERVLEVQFDSAEGHFRLVAELMGRLSNLILVDGEGTVRDSARRITPEMTRARVVLPRQAYVPPPPMARPAPDEVVEPDLERMLAGAPTDRPLWRVLTGELRGLSPLAAREAVFRAVGDAEGTVGAVDRVGPLIAALRELARPLADGEWSPSVVREDGAVVVFAPYRLTHVAEAETAATVNEAVAAFFEAQIGRDAYAAARSKVQAAITAARERAERQRAALEREILGRADVDRLREWGEWVLAYAHAVAPGADAVTVPDTGEGRSLVIPLDPTLTAVENAQKMFREYDRARRAAAELPPRLEAVEAMLQMLDQLATDAALAETRPEIDAVRAQLDGVVGEKGTTARPVKAGAPLEVESPDGFPILVGRNSRQNEVVTFERAAGHDLWLHARGVPGAHVIVKTLGREVPAATVEAAASLAAYYSAARGSTTAAVDVTEVRRVRRLKGGGPGLVTYSGERTLHATPRAAGDFE